MKNSEKIPAKEPAQKQGLRCLVAPNAGKKSMSGKALELIEAMASIALERKRSAELKRSALAALTSLWPGAFKWEKHKEQAKQIKKEGLLDAPIFGVGRCLTLLGLAAESGDFWGVRGLLALGANPNASGRDGETPVFVAADTVWEFAPGQEECLEALFAAGADINAANKRGQRPMHRAANIDNIKAVRWLLSKGADASAEDEQGMSPLHFAAMANRAAIAAMLVEAGADLFAPPNEASIAGDPLELAMSFQSQSVANIIAEARRVAAERAELDDGCEEARIARRPTARL